MMGYYILMLGILFIICGFILIFISGIYGAQKAEKKDEDSSKSYYGDDDPHSAGLGQEPVSRRTEVRGGGVIMLGPIPIIIGSDNKSAQILVILTIVLMVLYFLLFV